MYNGLVKGDNHTAEYDDDYYNCSADYNKDYTNYDNNYNYVNNKTSGDVSVNALALMHFLCKCLAKDGMYNGFVKIDVEKY